MKEKKKYSSVVYIYGDDDRYGSKEYRKFMKKRGFKVKLGDKRRFNEFIKDKKALQIDTETNVTDFVTDRSLYVLQFGNLEGTEQHVFDIGTIDMMRDEIIEVLGSDITFFAQNGKFEYKVLFTHYGVKIKRFRDTMLAAKVLHAGVAEPGQNGLAGLLGTYLNLNISKDAQTTFDGTGMSPEQLYYATMDVVYLGTLYTKLMYGVKRHKFEKVMKIENNVLMALGDMELNGVRIDTVALDENIKSFTEDAEKHRQAIIDVFMNETDDIMEKIRDGKFLQKEDEIIINWKSSVQKKVILNALYPDEDIKSSAKATLLKMKKTVNDSLFIDWLLEGDTGSLESYLVSRHMNLLMDHGMFIKKGTINLNFNSPAQLQKFFNIWYPDLKGVGVKALKKLRHPIVMAYKKYSKAQKLVSSFGEKMYGYIEDDGKIHTNFNQIVPSGSRLSSLRPNLQQAPATEQFRRIFIPDDGWSFVDSDYSSAELYIAAYLSKDDLLWEAVEKGYDLHSYSSFHIFGQEWLDAGGSATPVGKPPTADANRFRKLSKGLSFSLLYGTGPQAFGDNAGLAMTDAKALMKTYFETFPKLAAFFKNTGEKALKDYMVREPIFGRIRFFNRPTNGMEVSHLRNAAMNYKPQAINGSMIKYAMILLRNYIIKNDVGHKVKLLLNIHDQILSMAKDDYAEEWQVIQDGIMEKAANYAVPGGYIKVDSEILKHWKK